MNTSYVLWGVHESGARPLNAKYMDALAKTMPRQGSVLIRFGDGQRVSFGTLSVPYVPIGAGATDLLPVTAGPREVLMLAYTYAENVIENAGLASDVRDVQDDLRESVRTAADALAWAGLDAELLTTWVEEHLRAVGRGESSFVIARGGDAHRGQLELFG